jgi:hypothetical protein
MKITGFLLLGVWLILSGFIDLLHVRLPFGGLGFFCLLIASGFFLLLDISKKKPIRTLGIPFLAIWCIATGFICLLNKTRFAYSSILLALLALATGLFLYLERGKPRRTIGVFLLIVWLVVRGVFQILSVSFIGMSAILAVFSIVVGVFLIIKP